MVLIIKQYSHELFSQPLDIILFGMDLQEIKLDASGITFAKSMTS